MSLDVDLFVEVDTGGVRPYVVELFSINTTHNLGRMADAVGLYKCLWRPEQVPIQSAAQLIPLLESGLAQLKSDPQRYRGYNSTNGWGVYEDFVPFVEQLLEACRMHPKAQIRAWV